MSEFTDNLRKNLLKTLGWVMGDWPSWLRWGILVIVAALILWRKGWYVLLQVSAAVLWFFIFFLIITLIIRKYYDAKAASEKDNA